MDIPTLNELDQGELLKLSRTTIEFYLQHHSQLSYSAENENLRRKSAAFVTLYCQGQLRGCVGQIHPDQELYLAIQAASISAAFSDPRFPPLRKSELSDLKIKIAVLSPLATITPDEIVIGKHGLLIEAHGRRGLLLPEVASDRGWNPYTFLENLCLKANLPPRSWLDAKLSGFTTAVFQEQ